MAVMSPERLQALTEALVGTVPARVHAYQTSVTFRRAIDTLARMLPAMVEGLLDDALSADNERLHREHLLRSAPPALNIADLLGDPPPSV